MELITIFVIFLLFILSVVLGIKLASILSRQEYTILCRKNEPVENKEKNLISSFKNIFRSSSKANKIPSVKTWELTVNIGGNQEDPKQRTPDDEPSTTPLSETYSIDDELEEIQKKRAEREKKRDERRKKEKEIQKKYNTLKFSNNTPL
jgi:hypothetical protein